MLLRTSFVSKLGLFSVAISGLLACGDDTSNAGGSAATAGGGAGAGGSASTAGGGGAIDPSCDGPLGAPVDPDTLPTCCPDFGEAHCVPDFEGRLAEATADCEGGGKCVPDVFIETGGVFTPPPCTSIGNAPGVCLSACLPSVAENEGILPVDVCAEHERCAPCISPLDDMPTGACELAYECGGEGGGGGGEGGGGGGPVGCDDPDTCEYDLETTCMGEPAVDPEILDECPSDICMEGGARCVPLDALDPEEAPLFNSCDAESKCVPDTFIERGGLFAAPICESVGGFEGRCLSSCLPGVAENADELPESTCADNERCAPCHDPFTGEPTGACELSCDPGPFEPPQTFAACCENEGGGICIPTDLVGEAADDLDATECEEEHMQDDSVCVPTVIFEAHEAGELFTATPCTTNVLVQLGGGSAMGGCLPLCIPAVANQAGLAQDGCPAEFRCVPCTNGGTPTGACEPQ